MNKYQRSDCFYPKSPLQLHGVGFNSFELFLLLLGTFGHDPVGLIFSERKIANELTHRSGDESGHVRMALKTVELMEKMTPSQRLGTAKLNNTELWMDVDGWSMGVVQRF